MDHLRGKLAFLQRDLSAAIAAEQQITRELEEEQRKIIELGASAGLSIGTNNDYGSREIDELMVALAQINERLDTMVQERQKYSQRLVMIEEDRRELTERLNEAQARDQELRVRLQHVIGHDEEPENEEYRHLLIDLVHSKEELDKLNKTVHWR